MFVGTAKIKGVTEHRQASGAGGDITFGQCLRVEVGAQNSFAWAFVLYFGDDRQFVGSLRAAAKSCGDGPAAARFLISASDVRRFSSSARLSATMWLRKSFTVWRVSDFLHYSLSDLTWRKKALSFSLAVPWSMAAAAWLTASGKSFAQSATNNAAAAFSNTMSRAAPFSPSNTAKNMASDSSTDETNKPLKLALERPTSSVLWCIG